MDFEIMPQVAAVIKNRARHEVYGYSLPSTPYFNSIVNWMKRRYSWDIEAEWVSTVPGVVPAVNLAVQAFTEEGGGVLIQRPVYPPFANAITGNGRKLVNNPLVLRSGKYYVDIEDFEQKIVDHSIKLFILCSPHNPVGRVWTKSELKQMGDICLKHKVLVVADEIHQDLTFPGVRHYPFPTIQADYNDIVIVCTAPSKTFNLAGLQTSNIIIPNPEIREKFEESASHWGLGKVNSFGMVACEAAYTHGDQWLDEAMAYIAGNMNFVKDFIDTRVPKMELVESQGLYLLWLDFRNLGLSPEDLERFLLDDAGLWLNQGYLFGDEGQGFARLNTACSRSLLATAMGQLEEAVNALALP